jgi:hypothetical protein
VTPLQQAYLNKLHATAAANLEFFKRNMPQLHARVLEESPQTTLDISDQGDLTLRYPDGTSRTLITAVKALSERLHELGDPRRRRQLLAFQNLRVQRTDSETEHGGPAQYFYSRLSTEFPDYIRAHFTKHYPDDDGLSRYPFFGDENKIPLLIVLGSDVGYQISRLVSDYQIRHLVLLETDIEAFRTSLFFHDYIELSRIAMEKGTDLTFIIEPDIERLSHAFMHALTTALPPFFVHGAVMFPAMPQIERQQEIETMMVDTLWQMFYGLGFFDDEIISIRHSLANLPKRLPIYSRGGVVTHEDAYAFVVGAGPSLDELMPLLKRYSDRALVISCGSALAALYRAGIRPDFHIEMERTALTYDCLVHAVPREFMREVRLITTQVMAPQVLDLFKTAWIVIKEADTMGNLLAQSGLAPPASLRTQPTVSNMGLSLALGLGFKKVCLFGVDVGYKDTAKHHAHDTIYYARQPRDEHLRQLLALVTAHNLTAPGNFGDTVKTNFTFETARKHLSWNIMAYPEVEVYNPNDGALIENAITIRAEALASKLAQAMPEQDIKARVLEQIDQAFSPLEWPIETLQDALISEFDRFDAKIRPKLNQKLTSRDDIIERIVDVYQALREEIAEHTPASVLCRGSLLYLLSLTYTATSIILDDEEAVAKATYDFGLIQAFLAEARGAVLQAMQAAAA